MKGDAGQAVSDACVDDFRTWLHRLGTSCWFAAHIANSALVSYKVVPGHVLDNDWVGAIDAALDQSAAAKHVGAILFPEIHAPENLTQILATLAGAPSSRWRVSVVPSERDARRGYGLVRVNWVTRENRETSVMGMAPLRSMPITRRAPYAAMVLWPTERENLYGPKSRKVIGIVEAAHEMSEDQHQKNWTRTEAQVKARFSHDGDDQSLLRGVAFRLAIEALETLMT